MKRRRITNISNSYEKIIAGIIFLIEQNVEINLAVVFNPKFEIDDYSLFMDWLESIGWLHNKNITVTIGLIKERDTWSDLANFIGEMVAKYADTMGLDQ